MELLLQHKRARDWHEMLQFNPKNTVSVYFDYWFENDRIYPIAIRIYNKQRDTLDCYIYMPDQTLLARIVTYYRHKNKKPYWVSFISDTAVNFNLAMCSHFEQYDVNWLSTEESVKDMLEQHYVRLYTISDHTEDIERLFGISVVAHYYVKSEEAYKVDFIKTAANIKLGATETNNMNQSINSIRTRISKAIKEYPNIVEELAWKQLSSYFN